jgi:broad specificity phosphatase PhoE/predicted kinase
MDNQVHENSLQHSVPLNDIKTPTSPQLQTVIGTKSPRTSKKTDPQTKVKEDNDVSVTVFFKVRNRIKKAFFKGKTLDELKELFIEKFRVEDGENEFGYTKQNMPPFYLEYPTTKVKFELENVSDLYDNCVLEVRSTLDKQEFENPHRNAVVAMRKLGMTKKLVIVMVGLPARGKTYIARKIARYLNWLGLDTKVFNVGQYRRSRLGAQQPATFFDPDNEEGKKARLHMAIAALDDMVEWLIEGGVVGIYDATNSTEARRRLVLSRLKQENMEVLFIESICEDPAVIEQNIRETKLSSPDYANMDPVQAVEDFRKRIKNYEKTYETIKDDTLSYVKVIDIGRKVISNRIESYLASRVVFFLMNLHIVPRKIYFTRHGQSEFNALGRIGGDSELTKLGDDYAHRLAEWVHQNIPPDKKELMIFTSTMKRTIQSTQYIPARKIRLKALDEIDAGEFDGLTYQEIAERYPEEYKARSKDKLRYRYPRGESYLDVIQRLEPVIFQIERQQCDVLVVSHQAVLRCLLAYFLELEIEECPYVDVPLHTIIQLTPRTYGCDKQMIRLIPERAGDTDN